jgi:hypothetical protein
MVNEYIRKQEERHRKMTLKEELDNLLAKYDFAGDPEFIGE